MNNADGRVVINFEFPISEVESSKRKIDKILQSLGENAGEDYKKSFTKNADAVKQHAEKTSKEISDKLGKDIKSKVDLNTSDAQERAKKVSELYKQLKDLLKNPTSFKVSVSDADDSINKVKKDIQEVPSDKKVKYTADSFDATRKADEIKRKTDEVPTKHNTTFNATDHTGGVFSAIKSHFDKVNNQGEKTHSIFKSIFHANLLSNAVTGAFGSIKNAISGVISEANKYALEQQTMNATWLTLTNSASKGKAMVNQINSMALAAQNSTEMVDQLSQKFYAINNNAKQTGQLTKAVLTLQDAFGVTDAAVENFGTQFSQMMANGKVSGQDMLSIVNTFPKLLPMLRDYERQVHHNSQLTTKDVREMMSKGKISSQDMINTVLRAGQKYKKATGNFTATIPGMVRTIKAEIGPLSGALSKPIKSMETPLYGGIVKWLSAKKTEKEFSRMGQIVSTGMSNVMKAFGAGKSVNVTRALDNAINGINKGLQGVFGWVSANAKDLKTIASSIASIGGQIAKSVWHDFASIITTIGNMFGITSKNAKGSSSAIHTIAQFLNGLSKNKAAIKFVSDAIVTMATIKGLDRVGGGLFSIGEKGYGAYRKIKFLVKGMQGIKDIKGLSDAEKGFLKFGNGIRKAGRISKNVFGAIGKLGKGAWNGIKFATKSFVKSFTNQLKIIGRGIKGLGSIAWNAAKSVGSKFLNAGKFLGSKLAQGIKATMKFSMGKRLAVGAVSGAAVAAPEIVNAVKNRHNANARSQDIGGAVGALAGGTLTSMIPVVGPMLAPVGAIIGKYAGRWGGQAVNKFTKGWQRNKPPKRFWSLENLGYSAHNMWNSFIKGVSNTIKWFKKNWREVGLYFVSPLAGAINSLYKHNKKFRKWVDGLVKSFKNAWHGVVKWFSNLGKDIQKSWRGMVKWFTKLGHDASNGLKSTWRSIVKWFKSIYKGVTGAWHGLTSWFGKLGSNAVKGFKKAWHGLTSWFKGIIDGIKAAWDGFWDKISGPLKFIGKIFSGKAKIGGIKFANGTDWRSRYGVPAIVNDAPGDNYREGLIDTDGSIKAFPDKRNLPFWLKPGQDIINGLDMARFFGKPARFSTGTVAIVNDKDLFSDSFNKINDTLKGILDESKKTNKKKEKGKDYGSIVSNALHKASYTTKSGAKVQWNIVGETIKKLRNTTSSRRNSARRSSSERRKTSTSSRKGTSTSRSRVAVSVTGASKLSSLRRAISAVAGTHKVKLSIATSGSTQGLKSALSSIGSKKARVSISFKVQNAKVINRIKSQLSKIKNRNAKITITTGKSEKTLARISNEFSKTTNSIYAKTRRFGSTVNKSWERIWSSANSSFSSFSSKQRSNLDKFSDRYIKGWRSLGSGVKSAQSHAMSDLENITGKGLNKVLSVINSGISKINSVIKDFGGNGGALSTISPVKYATGTGYRPITKPTFAVVNDGNDSPETGNREAFYRPATGEFGIFNGRNVPVMLNPGDEIFSASETKPFISATHFANGTGYLKHLYDLTKKYFAKPKKTLGSMLNYANSTKGAIGRLATGMFKKADKQALDWWSQLWSMVNDKINDGDLGPASGLLKAVEELGQGKHYSQSKRMSKFFADCSSLVSRALAKYYHVGWSTPNGWALTVAGLWEHAHKISRAEARPGDPVFWLPDTHVGVYAGHGRYYSAYGPNDGGPVGMQAVAPGATFGRFDGLNTEGSKSKAPKIKANNALQKKIRGQVGKGFWKTIQKIAEKYGDNGMASAFKLGGDIAQRARAIAKALKQAVPGATKNGLAGVIGSWVFESGGLNPAAVNPDGGASGFGQWLGSRKANLMAYARRHGKSWKDPATQINFAVNADGSNSAILKRILRSSGSASELALKFSQEWERGGYDAQHASAARSIVGALHGFANGGKILFPQFATVGEDGPEYVINPAKPSADRYLLEAIKDRASRAPQSTIADLSKILDFNQFRYSASNGWRTRSDAHTNNQVRAVTSNGMKGNGGDIHMVVKLNNKIIAQGVKPILDAQQADQIVIAEGGGSI